METGVVAAIIAGAFGLLGTALSIWAAVVVHNVRDEMQVRLLLPRLEVYKKLWSLMSELSPSLQNELSHEKRRTMEEKLRVWYYEDGNGVFLSNDARNLLVEGKEYLLAVASRNAADIVTKFSQLRSQMKNDIGVYGREELEPQKKI